MKEKCINVHKDERGFKSRSQGFTLIELLTVIVIIMMLSGLAYTNFQHSDVDIKGGVYIASSLVQHARELALTRNTTTRVMINVDPSDPTNFGNYMVVIYQDVDSNNTLIWNTEGLPQKLPANVYYDGNFSTNVVTNSISTPPQIRQFDLPSMTEGTGDWWATYDFTGNGVCSESGARFIVVDASLTTNGGTCSLRIPNENARGGFIVERLGSLDFFTTPAQIFSSTNQ